MVAVFDLAVEPAAGVMVAATHGRGAFALPVAAPLVPETRGERRIVVARERRSGGRRCPGAHLRHRVARGPLGSARAGRRVARADTRAGRRPRFDRMAHRPRRPPTRRVLRYGDGGGGRGGGGGGARVGDGVRIGDASQWVARVRGWGWGGGGGVGTGGGARVGHSSQSVGGPRGWGCGGGGARVGVGWRWPVLRRCGVPGGGRVWCGRGGGARFRRGGRGCGRARAVGGACGGVGDGWRDWRGRGVGDAAGSAGGAGGEHARVPFGGPLYGGAGGRNRGGGGFRRGGGRRARARERLRGARPMGLPSGWS